MKLKTWVPFVAVLCVVLYLVGREKLLAPKKI